MSLPDSRDTTYVGSSLPAIKSADLNDLQDWTVTTYQGLAGADCVVRDEFTGNTVNASQWLTTDSGGMSFTGHVGAGGDRGVLRLVSSSTYNNPTIATQTLEVGAYNFRIFVRARIVTSGSVYAIGLTGTSFAQFQSTGSGTWHARYGATPTDVDLGVAQTSTFQNFEIRSSNSTLSFLINGTSYLSVAYTDAPIGPLSIGVTRNANNGEMQLDSAKMWIKGF